MPTSRPLYVQQMEVGLMQNFVYLLGDPATHEALIVDPGWEVDRILKMLAQDDYKPAKLFLTHSHFDHINGVEEVLERFDIPVYAQQEELEHLPPGWRGKVKALRGGDALSIGTVPSTVLHTPGHTPGSQCLLVNGRLLSGDTLFIGACGRCDFPDSDPRKLYDSLANRLRPLDDQTILCPGHNYAPVPTITLGEEKRANPFLSAATVNDFFRLVGA